MIVIFLIMSINKSFPKQIDSWTIVQFGVLFVPDIDMCCYIFDQYHDCYNLQVLPVCKTLQPVNFLLDENFEVYCQYIKQQYSSVYLGDNYLP